MMKLILFVIAIAAYTAFAWAEEPVSKLDLWLMEGKPEHECGNGPQEIGYVTMEECKVSTFFPIDVGPDCRSVWFYHVTWTDWPECGGTAIVLPPRDPDEDRQ